MNINIYAQIKLLLHFETAHAAMLFVRKPGISVDTEINVCSWLARPWERAWPHTEATMEEPDCGKFGTFTWRHLYL